MGKRNKKVKIEKKEKKAELKILEITFALIAIGLALFLVAHQLIQVYKKPIIKEKPIFEVKYDVLSKDVRVKTVKVPAVDREGNGVITQITVEVMPGIGRTLVDINNLLFWADTQESIRKAKEVAQAYTSLNLSQWDLIYHVYANASVVGGPSAGAALAIITIAALLDKDLRDDVMITGAINFDGTIGPVGDILIKAKVAKANDANLFLVPLTQGKEIIYEEREICKRYGWVEYCTKEQIPKIVDVGEKTGIKVKEVVNISQAFEYFLK